MSNQESGTVLVQVVSVEDGREIGWGDNVAEKLEDRIDDIRQAIATGTNAVADSLRDLPSTESWPLNEVSASFGITLSAEAGAILSKASAGATFEVSVTFKHEGQKT